MHPYWQQYLPQKLLSSCFGLLANCNYKFIKNFLIKQFTQLHPVNMAEAVIEDPLAYTSFNHFFTRNIKPTVRPINQEHNVFTSPCDGSIYQIGNLNEDCTIMAKGHTFNLAELLGPTINHLLFKHGAVINIYLSPTDYHRVHMPVTGILQHMTYIPGKLFSVNNRTVNYFPNLFAKNERVVTLWQTAFGTMAIIMVGAMLVGSIQTTWAGTINPSHSIQPAAYDYPTNTAEAISLSKGDELGLFKMGSTVIVLLAENNFNWHPSAQPAQRVLMGQQLCSFQ